MEKAIEILSKQAIELLNAPKFDKNKKAKVVSLIEEMSVKINPACKVDNTFKTFEYGDATFTLVCPSQPAITCFQSEQNRRSSSPEMKRLMELYEDLGSAESQKKNKVAEEMTNEINELTNKINSMFTRDFKDDLVKAAIIGNPLKKGSLIVGGEKLEVQDLDWKHLPDSLIDKLLNIATSLFTLSDAEILN